MHVTYFNEYILKPCYEMHNSSEVNRVTAQHDNCRNGPLEILFDSLSTQYQGHLSSSCINVVDELFSIYNVANIA